MDQTGEAQRPHVIRAELVVQPWSFDTADLRPPLCCGIRRSCEGAHVPGLEAVGSQQWQRG